MAAAGAAGGWVHATGRYRRWRAGAGPRTNRRLSFSGAGGPAPAAPGWVVLPPALVLFACLARRARERLRAPPGGGALSPAPPPGGGAPRRPAAAAPGGLGDLDALLGLRLSRLPGGGGDLPPGGLETASFADLWSTRGGRARGFEFTAAAAVGRPRPPAAAAPEGRPPSALTVVTLAGSELHAGAVRLAASLHFWHPEAELRVYHGGARLRPGDARVLAGLRNVRVVPLEEVWAALVEEEGAPLAGSGAARGRGGVRTWEPLVLLHALLDGGSPGGVAYVPPWLGLRGWVDNLRHALDRDGAFLLCGRPDDAGGGGVCLQGLQGFALSRGGAVPALLEAQARCALEGSAAACAPFGAGAGGGADEILVSVAGPRGGHEGEASASAAAAAAGEDWYYSRGSWRPEAAGPVCHPEEHLLVGAGPGVRVMVAGGQEVACAGHERRGVGRGGDGSSDYSCRAQRRAAGASEARAVWASRAADGGEGAAAAAAGPLLGVGLPFRTSDMDAGGERGGRGARTPFRETPFAAKFMPSFLAALGAAGGAARPPHTTVFVGLHPLDQGRYFGSPDKVREVEAWAAGVCGAGGLSVEFFSTGAPESDVTLWNAAMLRALGPNAPRRHDFFLAAHADSTFSTPSWASLGGLVRQLEASEVPAFGVAGPLDTGEPGVLTHPLVHRTHLDVFGYLFPPALTPPESFSWLSDVYGPRFTYVDSKYGGWKPGPLAARYPPSCHPRAEYLAQALDEAGPALRRWLAAQESAAAREALLELQELSPDGALL